MKRMRPAPGYRHSRRPDRGPCRPASTESALTVKSRRAASAVQSRPKRTTAWRPSVSMSSRSVVTSIAAAVDDQGHACRARCRSARLQPAAVGPRRDVVRRRGRGEVDLADRQPDQRVAHGAADDARFVAVARRARRRSAGRPAPGANRHRQGSEGLRSSRRRRSLEMAGDDVAVLDRRAPARRCCPAARREMDEDDQRDRSSAAPPAASHRSCRPASRRRWPGCRASRTASRVDRERQQEEDRVEGDESRHQPKTRSYSPRMIPAVIAPNIAPLERHLIETTLAPVKTPAAAPVVGRRHQERERHLEGVLDLLRVERQPVGRVDAAEHRHDAIAGAA